MLKILRERLHQGYRTIRFPAAAPPALPERFRGMPLVDHARCAERCKDCVRACPTNAVQRAADGRISLDLGSCLFCAQCAAACPRAAIMFTRDHRLAARSRDYLRVGTGAFRLAEALAADLRRLLGRSLSLRQVSAGGCNACEADANVLTTIGWDMGRFGIQFVASPRHADGLLVTGPVTANMRLALEKTYAAIPDPKIVVACGACAISGGPYKGAAEASDGVAAILRPDLFVPGCPPHPLTLLDGLLRLLGRIREA
jgi:Ni,Fe-hydrogenase III small subunit/ferredoxin